MTLIIANEMSTSVASALNNNDSEYSGFKKVYTGML